MKVEWLFFYVVKLVFTMQRLFFDKVGQSFITTLQALVKTLEISF